MNYIFYNLIDGQITQSGNSIEYPVLPKDFGIIELDSDIHEYFDVSAYYVDIKTKKIINKPPKPNGFYKFNYESKLWELDQFLAISSNKAKRNDLLLSSDWTQLPDVDLTQVEKDRWKVYRQELRDVPQQQGYPTNVIWPVSP